MGTLLAVTMPLGRPDVDARHVEAVFQTAASCEDVMSRHRPDAHVSRLNARAGDPEGIVSPELVKILTLARKLSAMTDRAFDPTITPVFEVWRRASARGRVPSLRRLRQTLDLVGCRKINISGSRVTLERSGMAVDLGGLGKGLALDRIADRLRHERCESAMLNFGESSLVAIGQPPGGRWTVVLRHPAGGFVGEFELERRAGSTSATFGQTLKTGSRRVGHVLDPRTGRPVRVMAQVTVLARTAAVAEAASTALLVLGRASIAAMARRLDIDVCWVDRAGVYTTPSFPLRRLG